MNTEIITSNSTIFQINIVHKTHIYEQKDMIKGGKDFAKMFSRYVSPLFAEHFFQELSNLNSGILPDYIDKLTRIKEIIEE